jgi:phosphoglycerate dehydrogenase-like enzyme
MVLSPARVAATHITMPADWQVRFLESTDEAEIISTCRDADCIVSVGSVSGINARIITNCPNLKLIQCLGVGFNQVDLATAEQRKIPVANSPGQNASTVAEFTIGSIIALQRRFLESDAEIKAGRYTTFRSQVLHEGLQEIGGSRLGLIGIGNIGLQVAKIAVLLGASVSYYTKHRRPADVERQLGITYQPMDDLLVDSNIVSLHVPLNETTRGLIGARELARMKVGSLLVNTSRGPVVDQVALAHALESSHLAGAAIDTFDPEPPDVEHPLLRLTPTAQCRLLLTPHTAGITFPSFRRMLAACVANMERVLRGEPVMNQVNRVSNSSRNTEK